VTAGRASRTSARAEWRAERAGWAAMASLVLAASLGLFGEGPLARAEATGPDGVVVRFARFARARLPERLTVALPDGASSLRVSAGLLVDAEILDVTPPPRRVRYAAGEHVYEFDAAPGAPLEVTFRLQYPRAGRARGWVAGGEGPRLELQVFVHP
jgi:hypothetical protein